MNITDDLPWLAFCYVANELDQQQRELFETRLDTDQAAREAVAHAMEMADSVVAAGLSDTRTPSLSGAVVSSGWMQGVMGAAFGAALCMVMVVTLTGWLRSDGDSEPPLLTDDVSPETEYLATLWSETREPLDELPWSEVDVTADDRIAPEEIKPLPDGEHSAWIQAAVFGMAMDETEWRAEPESEGTL